MHHTRRWTVVAVTAVLASGCGGQAADDTHTHSHTDAATNSDGSAFALPNIPDPAGTLVVGTGALSNVSVDAAGETVAVGWYSYDEATGVERTSVATSTDGGASFGDPVVVDEPATEHPQVDVLADGTILVGSLTYDLDLLLDPVDERSWPGWPVLDRSTDGGATFERIADLHGVIGDRLLTLGLPIGMAASSDGRTIVFSWNDRTPAEYLAPGEPAPVVDTNRQPVWASVSVDGGATFGPPQVAADSTCNCCRLDTFVSGDRAGVAYRSIADAPDGNASRDERNIGVTIADAAGTFTAGRLVHDDDFVLELAGCPDSGPGVATAEDGTIHAAWWTQVGGQGVWRYATSSDGSTFSEPVDLPNEPSVTGSVETTVGATGDAWIVGSSFGDGYQSLRVWRVPAGGEPIVVDAVVPLITFSTEPYDIAAVESGAVVVWLRDGEVRVARVTA